MQNSQTPRWLRYLERKLSFLAIPNIAILLVTLQGLGFFFVMMDRIWLYRFALIPEAVFSGEIWRVVTFLALPLAFSPIWVIFALWFMYFIVNTIEQVWGAFQTTFYILFSWVLMVAFSLTFNYPITQITDFNSTLFLAAASLFPEMQVQLFLIFPVKVKWLAWVTMALVLYHFISGGWLDRFYLLTVYANYILFFYPVLANRIKQRYRKNEFHRKLRR